MRHLRLGVAVALLVGFNVAGLQAAEVAVKGVHLCCGACLKSAKAALADVDGVSDANANQKTKTVSFQATDEKSTKAGLKALADAGFHGAATADGKKVSFPTTEVKAGLKADSVKLTGVHLCCGACVNGVKKAVQGVAGVSALQIDRDGKTVSATGKNIDVAAFVGALNKSGFHGELSK